MTICYYKYFAGLKQKGAIIMFYNIIVDNTSSGKLFMPHSFLSLNGIYNTGPYTVSAGIKSKVVNISIGHNINDNTLILSSDVVEYLSIPIDVKYQIRFKDGQFFIGPLLGLLFAKKKSSLSEEKLLDYTEYAANYSGFQGLLCLFSEDSIDFENNLVEGYYIHYDENDNQLVWKKSVLPLPKSIYRRSPLSNTTRKKIVSCTENKIFNSHYLSKWEFWRMAKKIRNIKKHIPKTKRFRNIDDIEMMLEQYDSIYLKPQNGKLSNGLIKVTMGNGCYFTQTKEDLKPVELSNKEELNGYLRAAFSSKKYIIQQGIDILKSEKRCTSFRVIMQKGQNSGWHCNGIIAYLGKKNGICSNNQTSWYEPNFENFISNLLSISKEEASLKKQELINLCFEICSLLDMRNENFADIGIEVGIDNALNLWIFEANCRNNSYPPLDNKNNQTYNTIINYPIKYGVSQSGF
jgi:hypothetical protein